MSTEHVPTPYTVNGFGVGFHVIARMESHGVAISASKPCIRNEIETADFICRACNSHDALIAALERHGQHDNDCTRWVHDEFDIYAGAVYDEMQPCSCGLDAALKAAKGAE